MFIGRPVSLARRAPSARSLFTSAQCLAKPAAAGNDKAYSATLLLPKTDFPLKHKDAVAAEMRFRELTTDQIYRSQVRQAVLIGWSRR
jgi:isoleucyl-tRNA synthetase